MIRHLLFGVLVLGAALMAQAQPKAVFLKNVHNFGAFAEEDGLARCEFPVVNMGTEPLTILSARATCGCTTPEYPRKAIAPGDTAFVKVAYDPAERPGRFAKNVFVETNGEPAKIALEIKGVVIGSEESINRRYPYDFGPLKLSKPAFSLGEATMGRLKTVYLDGYNRSADSLRISFDNVPKYVDLVAAPPVVGPGEQVTVIAYVAPHKGADYGIVEDTVQISPAPGLWYGLPLLTTVKEDFSKMDADKMEKAPMAVPSVERIELGKVSHDSEPIVVAFILANEGKSELKIRRLHSVDPGVTAVAKDSAVKKGKKTAVTVTIDPKQFHGAMINSRLQVITNDPLHPVYNIRVVGEWDE